MLNENRIKLDRQINKITTYILISAILVLLSFASLQYSQIKDNKESKQVINIFGKQRMYLQKMNKDINYLYILLDNKTILDIDMIREQEINDIEINNKIKDINQSQNEITTTLNTISKGQLFINNKLIDVSRFTNGSNDDIKKIRTMWSKFLAHKDLTIDYLYENIENHNDMTSIISTIRELNEENIEIYNQIEKIQNKIITESVRIARSKEYIAYIFIMILIITIFISAIQLKKVKNIILQLHDITLLIENMNNNYSFDENMEFIYNTFSKYVPYNYIGIALLDEKKENLIVRHGVSDHTIIGLPERMLNLVTPVKDTSLDKILSQSKPRVINDLEKHLNEKPYKEYNDIIYEAGIRSSITLPLDIGDESIGVIFFSCNRTNVYKPEHVKFLSTIENSIAISMKQNIYKNELLLSSIIALAKMVEARDEETGDHLNRMKFYSKMIAELLYYKKEYIKEIDNNFIKNIEKFSPLHDIGKVRIRDDILLKPGKLTVDEFNEMKNHTIYGVEILKVLDINTIRSGKNYFSMAKDIVESHHEKWDGSGYPNGKAGEDIPLSARIVTMADIFDAFTSERPYKKAFSFDKAYEYIIDNKGKIFDPIIADIFIENKGIFRKMHDEFKLIQMK